MPVTKLLVENRYQVGQRLRHPQFGEGLVVEVHTDRGREMLEVVFEGQLRRLSAQRDWDVVRGDGRSTETPSASAAARDWHPQGHRLLEWWQADRVTPAAHFDLRAEAERWAGWAGTDRL